MIDTDLAAAIESLRSRGCTFRALNSIPLAQARVNLAFEAGLLLGDPDPTVEEAHVLTDEASGATPLVIYRPRDAVGACAALVYFHGGGFSVGEPRYWRDMACELVRSGGFAVVLVDYRLAPEHPFPAAYEDGLAVVRYLRERGASLGIDPRRIALGGDSAGANLALAVSAALTSAGKPDWLAALLLIYGVYSRDTTGESWRQLGGFGLSSELMQWIWQNYLQRIDEADWRAFPLEADLSNLPPVVSVVGQLDPLITDNIELKRRLDDLNIVNSLTIVPGLPHGVIRLGARVPKVRALLQQSAAALKEYLIR